MSRLHKVQASICTSGSEGVFQSFTCLHSVVSTSVPRLPGTRNRLKFLYIYIMLWPIQATVQQALLCTIFIICTITECSSGSALHTLHLLLELFSSHDELKDEQKRQ